MIIVQIGANKGNTDNDPIYHTLCNLDNTDDVTLVLIEPHPKAKAILENVYHFVKNKIIVQCGVGSKPGIYKFYTDNETENNVSQHSSFNKQQILSQNHKESDLTEYHVPILTLESILTSLNLVEIDYLQIDTEGYDKDILMDFPFRYFKIKKLQFEILHWDAPFTDKTSYVFIRRLCFNGYDVINKTNEDVCLKYQ